MRSERVRVVAIYRPRNLQHVDDWWWTLVGRGDGSMKCVLHLRKHGQTHCCIVGEWEYRFGAYHTALPGTPPWRKFVTNVGGPTCYDMF